MTGRRRGCLKISKGLIYFVNFDHILLSFDHILLAWVWGCSVTVDEDLANLLLLLCYNFYAVACWNLESVDSSSVKKRPRRSTPLLFSGPDHGALYTVHMTGPWTDDVTLTTNVKSSAIIIRWRQIEERFTGRTLLGVFTGCQVTIWRRLLCNFAHRAKMLRFHSQGECALRDNEY